MGIGAGSQLAKILVEFCPRECYHKNMISEYILKKLKEARYKLLKNGSYFGEIPGLRGVWANAKNLEDCRKELRGVLEDWLLLKIRDREKVPGFSIKVDRRELVKTSR